tara:strand:- start:50 stop:499 length:450 start_codon:yes stop_codon:yes gene_type:complete
MTKDSFNRKKNYSNTKIIQLDPLGERLSNVGMTGGASARKSKSSDIKIITVKPLIKRLKSVIDKRRSDIRKYRKDKEKESSKSLTAANKAQERLETADEFRAGVIGVFKTKIPKNELKKLKKPFDTVMKKRSVIRNALAHPEKIKKKSN